jgi:hypothetical protein
MREVEGGRPDVMGLEGVVGVLGDRNGEFETWWTGRGGSG